MEGSTLPEKDSLYSMQNDSAQGSWWLTFSSLLRASNPRLASRGSSLLSLPLIKPRASGCKWNFVIWSFNRLSAFLALSPWWIGILLLFTAGCYLGSFLGSGAVGWVASLGFRLHASQGKHSWWLKCPSGTSAATHESLASPLVPPYVLPVLWLCGFFCKSLVIRLLSS